MHQNVTNDVGGGAGRRTTVPWCCWALQASTGKAGTNTRLGTKLDLLLLGLCFLGFEDHACQFSNVFQTTVGSHFLVNNCWGHVRLSSACLRFEKKQMSCQCQLWNWGKRDICHPTGYICITYRMLSTLVYQYRRSNYSDIKWNIFNFPNQYVRAPFLQNRKGCA